MNVRATVIDIYNTPDYGGFYAYTAIINRFTGQCVRSLGMCRARHRSEWGVTLKAWFKRLAVRDPELDDWVCIKEIPHTYVLRMYEDGNSSSDSAAHALTQLLRQLRGDDQFLFQCELSETIQMFVETTPPAVA